MQAATLKITFGKHFIDVTYDEAVAIRDRLCKVFGPGPEQTVQGAYQAALLDGLNAPPAEPSPARKSKPGRVYADTSIHSVYS